MRFGSSELTNTTSELHFSGSDMPHHNASTCCRLMSCLPSPEIQPPLGTFFTRSGGFRIHASLQEMHNVC